LLQLETPLPAVTEFARAARARGVKVVLNAAPAQALPAELLALIDVLIVNEDELVGVSGRRGGTLAERLATLNVPCAIVTLGSRGCCAWRDRKFFLQSSFRVETIDTTAAGDTFCGVLTAALDAGMSLPDALRRASAAAALATTRIGAQSSIPTRDEVDTLLRSDRSQPPAADLAAYCGIAADR
jgi:ribokinase